MSPWLPTLEGTIPFPYEDETHQTFYRVFGDIENRTKTPLVVLHGGPGFAHDYMLPISDLSSFRPVIFYDQIGNSRSTHLPDKPASFWTIDLFLDELENVLRHFEIIDNYDLIGHSWGGMMAAELVIRRQPTGLRRIILTNSLAKMSLWRESNAQLMKAFPQDIQDAAAVGMRDLKVSGPALKKFREKHGCLVQPFPEEYVYTLDQLFSENSDTSTIKAMFPGELKDWDVSDKLHLIRQPTFVINGTQDISQDFVNIPFFRSISRVKWITLENTSHLPMWEAREKYNKLIEEFLDFE